MSTDNERIENRDIESEMQESYLDYAMSVIVSRALPDVRDGLKPVHRRILFAMNDLGLFPERPYRKSAHIVGEVLGKYHPHGDTAVYDAMVRLAQEFSTRYPLVDGQGNYGSVDGDKAAAMRYTEAKMEKLTMELLKDIGKDTVNFKDNYDESAKEPVVLPSKFPNLLVNGSYGIAVGMATSIPPHNLREVIDGLMQLIDNPDMEIDEILEYIKGPDFPTGAVLMGKEGLKEAYKSGRGKVAVRARAEIEYDSKNKPSIIVNEIPYQVNKARVIEKIAELVRDKKIEGITDLRDESDRDGLRIVVELRRDVNPHVILNQLYKFTQLQVTSSIIMIALVENRPRLLNIKEMMNYYLLHQYDIIERRTKYDLRIAEARKHILEGLVKALDHIDEVIKIIRGSSSTDEAKKKLIEAFEFSDKQASSILEMRLQRLTGLEREKIDEEYTMLSIKVEEYTKILSDDKLIYEIVKEELIEIRKNYGDKRRTEITYAEEDIDMEDLIEEEEVVISLTNLGYIKRMPEDTYKTQKRGGRGVTGTTTRDKDFVENIFTTSTHDSLLFFTNKGRVYSIKSYEVPEASRQAKGVAVINLMQLDADENISAVIPISEFTKDTFLLFATKKGIVKKLALDQLANIRKTGIRAITLRDEDELITVKKTTGEENIIAVTTQGIAIRFKEEDVRPMGRTASGVKAITLNSGDNLIGIDVVEETNDLLVITEKGYGKRTSLDEYRVQKRGGKGVKTYNLKEATGNIISAKIVDKDDEVMMTSTMGIVIRLKVSNISKMGRITQGVKLMKMSKKDTVSSVATIILED